jgi:hypothetical protein
MRQREQVERVWYVSWDDGYGDKGQLPFVGSSKTAHWQASQLRNDAKDPKRGKHYGVRVRRVTRYRLAPLVEIAGWKLRANSVHHYDAIGPFEADAYASPFMWRVTARAGSIHMTGHGPDIESNMAAAEAALAWLGYRVAKEKRR